MAPPQNVTTYRSTDLNFMKAWQSVLPVAAVIFVLGMLAAPAHARTSDAPCVEEQEATQAYVNAYYDIGTLRTKPSSEFGYELEGSKAAQRGSEAPITCPGFCGRQVLSLARSMKSSF